MRSTGKARRVRTPGVFERGATQLAPGSPTRHPRWGGGGMPRRPNAAGLSSRAVKRTLDIMLSGLGLVASAPLWAIIAATIKITDGGPVFFIQTRVGERGLIFDALKFRSMIPDAERGVGPVQAAEFDPRVTRVGRLLRATAMDELPQLWNIFRGDMSFVGPRALRPEEIDAGGRGVLD